MFRMNCVRQWLVSMLGACSQAPHGVSRNRRRKSLGTGELLEYREMLSAIVVTSLADNTTQDGLVTLREAIAAANGNIPVDGSIAGSGADVISFAPDLNGMILLNLGEMEIVESLTITGNGAQNTIIDGNNASRIFSVSYGDTTFEKLTLTHGKTTINGPFNGGGGGGAIRSTSTGTLTVSQSTISGNSTTADFSGGGAIMIRSFNGELTIRQSTFSGNSTSGNGASGGAIYVFNPATISDSTFSENSTGGFSNSGGAIFAGNTLTVVQSKFSGNSTAADGGRGGAIYANGRELTVSKSTFSGNSTLGLSGKGGAIFGLNAPVTVSQSTLSGNSTAGAEAAGGSIATLGGKVTVIQSTLSGNTTLGTQSPGGAIYTWDGDVMVNQSTLTENHATKSQGGGIFSKSSQIAMQNSIVATNTDDGTAPDIRKAQVRPFYVYHSLIGQNSGTENLATVGSVPNASGNFFGSKDIPINPQLGPLANNGGPVFTHLLLAGSLAINSGNNSLGVDAQNIALTTDQRGESYPRIVGTTVDLGAVEFTEIPSLVVTTSSDIEEKSDGLTSLREAIGFGNSKVGADTITFGNGDAISGGTNFTDSATDTILLASGQLTISKTLTITGLSATKMIIDGGNAARIFDITSGDTTLEKLTLMRGRATGDGEKGGAIKSISTGTLTLSQSALSGNSTTGGFGSGGAIYSSLGAVKLTQSTLSGNSTTGNEAHGGAIFANSGAVTLSQTTISGNSTAGTNAHGGAVFASNSIILRQSTLTGNHADKGQGGAIYNSSSLIAIQNSIVAGNIDNSVAPDIRRGSGTITVSHTLIGDNAGTDLIEAQAADSSGNFIGSSTGAGIIDPNVGALANNGGPTKTHALLSGSLAIDHGSNSLAIDVTNGNAALVFDQRGTGFNRVIDGDSQDTALVDIGAFEFTGLRLISPNATTFALRPTLMWTAIVGSTSYNIWVNNQSTSTNKYYSSSVSGVSQIVTVDFAIGKYRVWIQPVFVTGPGNWSTPSDIFVLPPVILNTLPKLQLVSRPTISWNALPGAVKYDLWIDNVSTGQSKFVRQDIAGTNYTPPADWALGTYRVWVRGVDKIGNLGAWSAPYEAQILPGPTPIGPLDSTLNHTPTFSWKPVAGANIYDLWVDSLSTGITQVIRRKALTTPTFTPESDLPTGGYRWWVRAVGGSSGGLITGQWSAGWTFTIGGAPTSLTPVASTSDISPTFTWSPVDGANSYELQVDRLDKKQSKVIFKTGLPAHSFTPSTPLAAGTYRVWVRSVSSTGEFSFWTAATEFSVRLAAPSITSPANNSSSSSKVPTFTWNAVDGASRYEIWVDRTDVAHSKIIYQTDLASNSLAASTQLPAGMYRAWVRAVTSTGQFSYWSTPVTFTIAEAARIIDAPDSELQLSGIRKSELTLPIVQVAYEPTWIAARTPTTKSPAGEIASKSVNKQSRPQLNTMLIQNGDDASSDLLDLFMGDFAIHEFHTTPA
jgi:CSLREA domain-containing protein